MKAKFVFFNVLTLLALAVVLLRGQGNGPLNPPAAPADGVYRTLNELYDAVKAGEPRTPIVSADLPLTIDQAGSYYLAENLTFSAATGNAITVTADDVTIDLNGFTISSTPAVTGDAINANTALIYRLTVRNGTIRGNTIVTYRINPVSWTTDEAGFTNGINGSNGFRVVDVNVTGCRNIGLKARQGVVEGCTAFRNGGHGISANGGQITRCVATQNGGHGIDGSKCLISQCKVAQNEGDGIRVIDGTISTCLATENGGTGLAATVVVASVSMENDDDGINAKVVSQSGADQNGANGITSPGATVSLSAARFNGGENIDATGTRTGNTPAP